MRVACAPAGLAGTGGAFSSPKHQAVVRVTADSATATAVAPLADAGPPPGALTQSWQVGVAPSADDSGHAPATGRRRWARDLPGSTAFGVSETGPRSASNVGDLTDVD
jgi:hypothetical protein